jgi:hypothetical protein
MSTAFQTNRYLPINEAKARQVSILQSGHFQVVKGPECCAVEANVVEGTVRALQLKLLPEEETALLVHGTSAPAASNFYLRARGYLVDYTKADNVENAIRMNRDALKLDPNFGAAKAGLGEAYCASTRSLRTRV